MSQAKILVVPLTRADEPLLADLTYEAIFIPEGAAPAPRSILDRPELRKYFAGFGSQVGDIGRKAVDSASGATMGAAWTRLFTSAAPGYGYVDDNTPELSIVINPAYRGQGIGTRLLEALCAAVAQDYAAITLSVWSDNPAYRLYKRLGFVVVAQEEENPVVTMVKRLRGAY